MNETQCKQRLQRRHSAASFRFARSQVQRSEASEVLTGETGKELIKWYRSDHGPVYGLDQTYMVLVICPLIYSGPRQRIKTTGSVKHSTPSQTLVHTKASEICRSDVAAY